MILTCPNCSTRYQADATRFPAGRNVRCAKCAFVWHQTPPPLEPEPELAIVAAQTSRAAQDEPPPIVAQSEPPAVVTRSEPRFMVTRPEPEPSIITRSEPPPITRPRIAPQVSAFVPRAEPVQVEADEEGVDGPPLVARLATAAGWAGLALVVLLIGWATVSFRGDIIALWPQSASVYRAVGLSLKAKGIQFVGVTNHVETQDGSHVLIVTGRLINNSNRELPVPPIRIALTDVEQHELYHWPVVSNVPTLKPGEAAPFQARLANPPGAMHDVEVTFVRADE
jgi:predicted Zn finger-like uncharacterized protein